jgi:hypothetical protein
VEHELDALTSFLPREPSDRNPEVFRMDGAGERTPEDRLCVSSREALEVVAERAAHFIRLLRSTTGRHFYWGR